MTQLVITLKDQSYLPNIRRIVKTCRLLPFDYGDFKGIDYLCPNNDWLLIQNYLKHEKIKNVDECRHPYLRHDNDALFMC